MVRDSFIRYRIIFKVVMNKYCLSFVIEGEVECYFEFENIKYIVLFVYIFFFCL